MARKLITLDGVDVCQTAWWKVHGVSRATYMVYRRKSRIDFVCSVHGKVGFLRPRKHVQAEASMQFVIRMNADLMLHKMKSLGVGRQDVRMVLPSDLNWKRMQEDVNEVISFTCVPLFLILLLLSGDRPISLRHLCCLRFHVLLLLLVFCVFHCYFISCFCSSIGLSPNTFYCHLFFIPFMTFWSYRELS